MSCVMQNQEGVKMLKIRKKEKEPIEAIQFEPHNLKDILEYLGIKSKELVEDIKLQILILVTGQLY